MKAADACGKVLRAMVRRLPRVRHFVVRSGAPEASGAGALGAIGMSLSEMTEESLAGVSEFRKAEVVKQLRDYLARGCRGFLAMDGGEIAAYGMLAEPAGEPEVFRRFVIRPGEAGAILFYTRDEYRGRGIATALLLEASAIVAGEARVSRVVAWTVPSNAASIRVLENGGLTRHGEAWIFEFWGRPLARVTRGVGEDR